MLLYACQHYVNSCMNIFIHKIFPMLIIYHTRATVATICTLSMIPAIRYIHTGTGVKNISPSHKDCGLDCNRTSRILHCHVNQLSNKIKD